MRSCASLFVLVAVCGLGIAPGTADACGRRHVVCYTTPIWCPPCPPCPICCPPDEKPLDPLPVHPVPHGTTPHKLALKNDTHLQSFAIIYIRYPDCVYRVYDKKPVLPNTTIELDPKRYFAGDHLLVETWTRKEPTDPWHCRCVHLITLVGASGTFDVTRCSYTHP